jgi:predicted ATPase
VSVSDAALSTALKEIRTALEDDGATQLWVQTLRGRGYRFIGDVAEIPSIPPKNDGRPARVRTIGRVPHPISALVGRDKEIESVGVLLQTRRLVTIYGPGGVGKTRLAIAAASLYERSSGQEVYFIDLSPVSSSELVADIIAQEVGMAERSDYRRDVFLEDHLNGESALIVLDNFEHLMEATSRIVHILETCPRISFLITSRFLLGVPGEQGYATRPLPYRVPSRELPSVEELLRVPAIALFVQRASDATDFVLDQENAPDVVSICERLDGLPLAIELAAARVLCLTPSAILNEIETPSARLGAPSTVRPDRHQNLHKTVAWTCSLLPPDERRLLSELSVFRGGFTLEAAQAVSKLASTDTLRSLLAKSLLHRETSARFDMLRTVSEFASRELETPGGPSTRQERHATFFARWLSRLTSSQRDRHSASREMMNITKALDWCQQESRIDLGARILWRARRFFPQARKRELSSRADHFLSAEGMMTTSRGRLLLIGGEAKMSFDRSAALIALDEATVVSRELGDVRCLARALEQAGVWRQRHDPVRAVQLLEEAVSLFREMQESTRAALGRLAYARLQTDGPDHAMLLVEEALSMNSDQYQESVLKGYRALILEAQGSHAQAEEVLSGVGWPYARTEDGWGSVWHATRCGRLALRRGDLRQASDTLAECVRILEHTGTSDAAFEVLVLSALLAERTNKPARSVFLLGAAGYPSTYVPVEVRDLLDSCVESVHRSLGVRAFEESLKAGMRVPLATALRCTREEISCSAY